MARFIHLSSTTPGMLGKIRVNVDHLAMYFPTGAQTRIILLNGVQETVKESIDKVETLLGEAGAIQHKPVVLS
jgi:hypothetical protein